MRATCEVKGIDADVVLAELQSHPSEVSSSQSGSDTTTEHSWSSDLTGE